MRRSIVVAVALVFILGAATAGAGGAPARHVAAAELAFVVTSKADLGGANAACPHVSNCTLRKAIELINADAAATSYAVRFDAAVFPVGTPATIAVQSSRLPTVTKADVTIDASLAGVVIDGAALQAGADGLLLTGDRATAKGLRIRGFGGACLGVLGPNSTIGDDLTNGSGNRLGDCGIGLLIGGASTLARGNSAGFAPTSDDPAPVTTGIVVRAASVILGGEAAGPNQANIVGNATTGIRVGEGGEPAFAGVTIARNLVGRNAAGIAAHVSRGIVIAPPASGVRVLENTVANVTSGVEVLGTAITASSANTIRTNRFSDVAGLAIDLGGNGVRDPNDIGDGDSGANTLLNYPVWGRTVQASLSGTACAGCAVDFYRAQHFPGGARDYGTLPFASASADGAGHFTLAAPVVVPGDWVIAIATDAAGNTSEFGPSARVGAGALQCANIRFETGWNHAGYFGPGGALGDTVPGDPQRRIRAVYQLDDSGTSFHHWLRDTLVGRTLTFLEPGEAYWFLVDAPLTLPFGFAVTAPLPVVVATGWNDFVYFGGGADTLDVLAENVSSVAELHRYVNTPEGGERWLSWGSPFTPGWARSFAVMEPCAAYTVKVTAPATITPPQP